ncbi:hypothetical protein [Catenuloplanes japonicus]|uniref:hypothetical protein n=1 Tax=Catenuloplanes japonicus TaxID=33876 RepID=UPI0005258330|nr:hypothetical protein [Catenuloplanes japonicus]
MTRLGCGVVGRHPHGVVARRPRVGYSRYRRRGDVSHDGFRPRRWTRREREVVAFIGATTLLCGGVIFLLGAAAGLG